MIARLPKQYIVYKLQRGGVLKNLIHVSLPFLTEVIDFVPGHM